MARADQHLKIDGLKELRDMLKNVAPKSANNAMRAATYEIAGIVLEALKGRVKKRTMSLQRSLFRIRRRGRPGEHVSEVRGGATAPYMRMLEWGTSRTRAQPFIVPTVEEIRPKQAELYREEFFKKLAEVLAREAKKAKR